MAKILKNIKTARVSFIKTNKQSKQRVHCLVKVISFDIIGEKCSQKTSTGFEEEKEASNDLLVLLALSLNFSPSSELFQKK